MCGKLRNSAAGTKAVWVKFTIWISLLQEEAVCRKRFGIFVPVEVYDEI
jgi:hypothetical protein